MASSGRVPTPVLALMNEIVKVYETDPNTDVYGEIDEGIGSFREVKCYLAPYTIVKQGNTNYSVTPNWVAYCDDIDFEGTEKVQVPDNDVTDVINVETYYDNTDKLYQVVTLV